MTYRAIITISLLCAGAGCTAAGSGADLPQVADALDEGGPAAPPEPAGMPPASATTLPESPPVAPPLQAGAGTCSALATRLSSLGEPLDFIVVLDNASNMEDELRAVEQSLNGAFGQLLAESDVDYRVILITEHRESDDQETGVCIQSPLSSLATCPSPEPGANERFFHYSTEVDGEDSLDLLLESFSGEREDDFGLANLGWSEWLRTEAQKVFLVLTTDDADMPAMEFAAALTELAPEQFGADPAQLRFTWHSVVGLAARDPAALAQAHLPEAPIEESECEGDVSNAGETYQELSRLTGGLRFPICELDAYGAMLQQIVTELASAQPSCDFSLPGAPPGRTLELGRASLSLQGAPTLLSRTADAASCAADAFFLTGEVVHLCPQTCAAVSGGSELQLQFSCLGGPP